MRHWINSVFKLYYSRRYLYFNSIYSNPEKLQEHWRSYLVRRAENTSYGKAYNFAQIKDYRSFSEQIPVVDYEPLKPFIHQMMLGQPDILWPGKVRWFAKSAGTSQDKSKFIPVSTENRQQCHLRGTWDTMMFYYSLRPNARQFEAKTLLMGGSISPFNEFPQSQVGDISAIMIKHLPNKR